MKIIFEFDVTAHGDTPSEDEWYKVAECLLSEAQVVTSERIGSDKEFDVIVESWTTDIKEDS